MSCEISLADFFETIGEDPRIGANHIVLYLAMFNQWQIFGCPERLEFESCAIIKMAKLTRTTYFKHILELHSFGYIQYQPAGNQFAKVVVRFKKL